MSAPVVAIVNPRAGGGRTIRRWAAYLAALRARGLTIETLETARPDHATALTREALLRGAATIIAVGGDGTANEVANGFFDDGRPVAPAAKFAFVPIGTGGDLQRTLQLPTEPDAVARAIAEGATRRIDVVRLRLTGHDGAPVVRYFVNLASFGMGGDVSIRAKTCWLTARSGKLAFLWATFAVFFRYAGKRVRFRLDDSSETHDYVVTNVALGNGRYHGGGMHPCPLARLDDGLLDVTVIERLNWFELIRDLPILYSQDVYRHPKVHRFQAARLVAEADETTRMEVDGEALGRLPCEARVEPAALRLIVPRGSEEA